MKIDPLIAEGNDTKIRIIRILDENGALNAKKIHSKLKENGAPISYQAAHKALKKMQENGVLRCEDSQFSIDPKWISKTREFINSLEKEPDSLKDIFSRLDSDKTVSFTVNSDMEMGYFALDFAHYFNKRFKKDEGPVIFNFHFMWTVLPLSHKQFRMFKEIINKRGVYATSCEDLEYDEIMKRHWEKAGAKVKLGVKDIVSNCEVIVAGDYIINNFWDPKHLEWNIEFTKTVNDEKSLDYSEFYKVLCAQTKTEIVIIKNKQVAESLRKRALDYFSK
ncbi:MAG: hypothetical protein KKE20_05675 [Nanoarchaeota archaeon]|nr:hypothetical protein [Nanoarchaeota archaeon]